MMVELLSAYYGRDFPPLKFRGGETLRFDDGLAILIPWDVYGGKNDLSRDSGVDRERSNDNDASSVSVVGSVRVRERIADSESPQPAYRIGGRMHSQCTHINRKGLNCKLGFGHKGHHRYHGVWYCDGCAKPRTGRPVVQDENVAFCIFCARDAEKNPVWFTPEG